MGLAETQCCVFYYKYTTLPSQFQKNVMKFSLFLKCQTNNTGHFSDFTEISEGYTTHCCETQNLVPKY